MYALEGKQAYFSFPLNFEVEDLNGELRWQSMGASSPQPWVTFSVKKKKVSLQGKPQEPKLTLKESLPLNFTLLQASAPLAGTGNLSLHLTQMVLSREVKLVVMKGEELGASEWGATHWGSPTRQINPLSRGNCPGSHVLSRTPLVWGKVGVLVLN